MRGCVACWFWCASLSCLEWIGSQVSESHSIFYFLWWAWPLCWSNWLPRAPGLSPWCFSFSLRLCGCDSNLDRLGVEFLAEDLYPACPSFWAKIWRRPQLCASLGWQEFWKSPWSTAIFHSLRPSCQLLPSWASGCFAFTSLSERCSKYDSSTWPTTGLDHCRPCCLGCFWAWDFDCL